MNQHHNGYVQMSQLSEAPAECPSRVTWFAIGIAAVYLWPYLSPALGSILGRASKRVATMPE